MITEVTGAITKTQPKRRYTLYTALIAGGMMLAVYLLLGVWPFGDGSIVNGDLGGLYLNFFAHLRRFFLGEVGFAFGFDKGLGGSLVGLYATYYASPFNILYLLFPVRWFPVAASLQLFIKIVLSCVFFRVYISQKCPKLHWRSVPLALCYGFMAYAFAYAQNIMWHDVVLLLPLICLGIDRVIGGRGFAFFTGMLALAIFSNFYTAYMACLFAVLYFFYTMLTRTAEERTTGWKMPLLRFFGGALIAGGLCAALLVPTLVNINSQKGDLLAYSFSFAQNFPIYRLPERLVWGSFAATDVNDALPFIYCGLLALVLACAYFASRAVPRRDKILSGAMLLLFVLSFWNHGLSVVWHGLKAPVWFPARFSFLFCFFVVLLAAKALAARAAGKREVLIAGGGLGVALLVMTVFPIAVSRSRIILSLCAVLFYAFCLVLAAGATSLRRRRMIFGVLSFLVAVELSLNGYFILSRLDQYTLSGHQALVDNAGGTVAAIQEADEGDYRIGETHYHSLNDPMLLGYSGLSHFSSTQDSHAQGVLYNLGFRNYEGGGPYLHGGTAFADSVLGIKYLSDNWAYPAGSHWQDAGITAPYAVRENPTALPMVFAFDGGGITDERHGEYETDLFAFQNDMYIELGYEGPLFTDAAGFLVRGADGKTRAVANGSIAPGEAVEITAGQSGRHYAWLESGTLLLPMYRDEVYLGNYFAPQYKGAIDLGWLEAGQTVTLRWDNDKAIKVGGARAVRMDDAKLSQLAEDARAAAGSFTIEDGRMTGSVTAQDGQTMLYTSVAYDADWRCEVNGETVTPRRFMGGLLAVPLQPGENTVLLRFVPGGAAAGLWISLGSAVVFLAALGAGLWRRQRAKQRMDEKGGEKEN